MVSNGLGEWVYFHGSHSAIFSFAVIMNVASALVRFCSPIIIFFISE